ncbi:hypothetical protein Bca4012_020551 [Brassica carinata]
MPFLWKGISSMELNSTINVWEPNIKLQNEFSIEAGWQSVWLIQQLANSVNMSLQIFRVEKDNRFDPVYMEATGDQFKDLVQAMLYPNFLCVR